MQRIKSKKKVILSVFVVAALLLGVAFLLPGHLRGTAMEAQGTTVSVDAPEEVTEGGDFTATIRIENVTDFDAANYTVTFDPSVLKLDDVTPGEINGTEIPVDTWNEYEPGKCVIVQNIPGLAGASGSGSLAVLHFHVSGKACRSSKINLVDGVLSDIQAEEIPAEWSGDEVKVKAGYKNISPQDAWGMMQADENVIVLDVRTRSEFEAEHIPGAKLIPLSELEARLNELDKDKAIIVYCKSGYRSGLASEILADHCFPGIYNMLGGITAWKEAGLPVVGASGRIKGRVLLQGREDFSGVRILLDGEEKAVTDSKGDFSIEVAPGTYTVTAVMPGFLPAVKSNVVVEPGEVEDVGTVLLLAGDLNGDGIIDIRDLVILGRNFGRTESPWK